jgi:heptosyltransferase I
LRRALLYLKGGMGDVVFALSLVADLRAGWPDVELWVLTHAQGQGVLDLCPAVTRTLSWGPASIEPTVRRLLETLPKERFDAALTPVRSPRAAYLLFRSRAGTRVGFGGGPEALLYTHRARVRPFEVAFSRRFERLAEAVGLPALGRPAPLVVSAQRRARAQEQLRAAGWDGEAPLRTLLVGGEADRPRAEAIAAHSDGAALLQLGNGVAESLAQLDVCTAAVGLDSGLSHAGVALGVPTVSLFGPNEPASVVLAPHQRMLVQSTLPCRPCNRLGKVRCPMGHHRCMRDTTPAQVLGLLEPLLALGEVRLRAQATRPR